VASDGRQGVSRAGRGERTAPARPDVSIIVPTHNRRALLERKLRALESEPPVFEVIVVADACSDDTEKFLTSYRPPYRFSWTTGPGLHAATARNIGAQRASGQILLFSDDDAIPRPGWVEENRRLHHKPDQVGLSRQLLPPHLVAGATLKLVSGWWNTNGCSMSLRAELFHAAGGYDASFSSYGGATMDRATAKHVLGELMDGRLSQVQAAALLAALRMRGETVDEITGFAEAMRERAIPVPAAHHQPLVDTCGTGGTGIDTINSSTTAMFVSAAGGARLAKHGNVGVTRQSGSADVLQALGARLELGPERLAQAIDEVGLAFVFARQYHPAMKFVAPIRADLQARTIFNNLGPLTNPAGADRQLMGVYSPELTRPLAEVLKGLGLKRALVVHGDGIDDFTVSGPSQVTELLPNGDTRHYEVTPEEVGLRRHPRAELAGGGAAHNAQQLRQILAGKGDAAKRDVVLFNAGATLYLAERADDLGHGVQLARQALDSGAALAKLDAYLAFTQATDGTAS
jgi:anthranilate phosphoribosyltransferase